MHPLSLNPAQARLTRLRWTAFALVVLGYMLSFFHRMAPAAIAGELQQAFAASGVALGSLAASYFYVYAALQIPTGVLVDTLGVRKIVGIGGLIAGAGSIVFATADSLATATIGRALVGLGVSAMFVAMMKLNAAWFYDRHFGTVAGFTVLLGNLGAVLSAAPLAWVLGYTSWRTVFVWAGAFSLTLGVLSWFFVRNHPGEAGLPSMRELEGQAPHPPHTGHWYDELLDVLRNRDTWPGFWPALGVGGTLLTFAGLWAVPFLQAAYAMTRSTATLHTALLLAGFAVGSFLSGAVSDRLGRRRPVMLAGIVTYLLSWLPLLVLMPLPPAASLTLFVLMGVSAGGFTLCWAVAKEVNRPASSGMAINVVNTGVFLGVAVFQPLVGGIMDLGWDGTMAAGARVYAPVTYQAGLGVLFGFALLGLVGTLKLRETYCRYVEGRS